MTDLFLVAGVWMISIILGIALILDIFGGDDNGPLTPS